MAEFFKYKCKVCEKPCVLIVYPNHEFITGYTPDRCPFGIHNSSEWKETEETKRQEGGE